MIFQINGHFGTNPSWLGQGINSQGGLTGRFAVQVPTHGCTARFVLVVIVLTSVSARAEIPGLQQALDPTVTTGTVIPIVGPPSTGRDAENAASNSVEELRSFMESYKGPGSVYQSIRPNWPTVQYPNVSLAQIGSLVQQQYQDVVLSRMNTPAVTQITVQPLTLIYPAGYYNNSSPVTVHTKRLTLSAPGRSLVAYYANYDKLADHNDSVVFQINGHFGHNPSRLGLGIEGQGGFSGAALGKIAMQGYPLLTYDDHNVGESSSAPDSLPRTLENVQMMDRTLLAEFSRVDAVGISGGTERLYHTMTFFESNIKSAYYAGFAVPQWTRLTSPPFGSDPDTHDVPFLQNFQWADLTAVGLARGVTTAFAHNTYEGGRSKYGYFEEIVPTLQQYTSDFQTRGDDRNGDGIPDYGPGLAHEYDLVDYFEWIESVRAVPEPTSLALGLALAACAAVAGGGYLLWRKWGRMFRRIVPVDKRGV